MLTNGCATLYNRWEEADGERCVRTVLPAVFWENALEGGFAGRRYSKKGQELLSAVRVLIPGTAVSGERAYLPPKAWRLLEPQERAAYFTFQIGDLLVFGDCPYRWDPQTPIRRDGQHPADSAGGCAVGVFPLGAGGGLGCQTRIRL